MTLDIFSQESTTGLVSRHGIMDFGIVFNDKNLINNS
jgi:hypothetical protein